MANIETDGFVDAIKSVERLGDEIQNGEIPSFIDDEADSLKRAMERNVANAGLIDTGALQNSFTSERDGDLWSVYSTKEYADYLNFGTSPHTITPSEKPVLSFEPENPAKYGDKYDEETGRVAFKSVDHPGNKPYKFADMAQVEWAANLRTRLRIAVVKAIIKARFTPR